MPGSRPLPMNCPICAEESVTVLHRFSAKQAAEHFVPIRRDKQRHLWLVGNIEKLWHGSECRVVQCNDCKFCFPVPYVAGDAEFYEIAYGVPSYPLHRWEYDRALEFLKSLDASHPVRILELGAGVGEFTKRILRIPGVSPGQVVATDYSPHSIDALRALGVDARRLGVADLASSPGDSKSFDVILAFQSIEHMSDIAEVISGLKQLLKPKGVIILSVPQGPAIEFNERYLKCFDMPPNHVGRWYRESFEALSTRTGIEVVAHEIEPMRLIPILSEVMVLRIRGVAAASPTSLAGRAQAIENRRLRRLLSAALGSVMLLPLLPSLRRLKSGYAQLAVLRISGASHLPS